MSEPKPKSFEISKWAVWEAYRRVKANKGAAGVDEQSIEEFEQDLQGNLYKLWNRLSSGSYFPPPVRAVEIPKKDGSSRMLGVPTVADRIAQTVVCGYLEPEVEPVFHEDSYGYRPGRSALTRSGSAGSGAGGRTGCSIWTSGAFFDTRSVGPRPQGGSSSHRPALDPALRGAVAESAAATRGRQPGRAGSRNPSGFCDLTLARQHVLALRVRCVDGPGVSRPSGSSATAMT